MTNQFTKDLLADLDRIADGIGVDDLRLVATRAARRIRQMTPAPQETAGEPSQCENCGGRTFARVDQRITAFRCVECKSVAFPTHPTPTAAPTDNTALVEAWEGERRHPTLAEAAKAARTILACNGMDLDAWTNGDCDFNDGLTSLIGQAKRAALASRPAKATSREGVEE